MNLLPGSQRLTSDSALITSGQPVRVYCVSVIAGAGGAANVTLYDGTSTGGNSQAIVSTLTASSGSIANFAGGLRFPNGCFVDLDANTSSVTIICDKEF